MCNVLSPSFLFTASNQVIYGKFKYSLKSDHSGLVPINVRISSCGMLCACFLPYEANGDAVIPLISKRDTTGLSKVNGWRNKRASAEEIDFIE